MPPPPRPEPSPPCAGVVVCRRGEQGVECLLVETHSGHWGFPKGRRERRETVRENALRELREETGLSPEHLELREDLVADELSYRGALAVRYLGAWLRDVDPALVRASDEHRTVAWVPIEEAFTRVRLSRREVLRRVLRGLGATAAE